MTTHSETYIQILKLAIISQKCGVNWAKNHNMVKFLRYLTDVSTQMCG